MSSLATTLVRFLEEHADQDHMDEDHHDEEFQTDSGSTDKPWGDVILASFLVQLVTLAGLVLVAFSFCARKHTMHASPWMHRLQHQIIPSFAGGALLATAVFLLIPEAFHLLQGGGHESHSSAESTAATTQAGYDDHGDEDGHEGHDHLRYLQEHEEEDTSFVWKFGAALLGGFLFPILLGAIFPPPDTSDCEECKQLKQQLAAHEQQQQVDETLGLCEEGECEEGDCVHKLDKTEEADSSVKEDDTKNQAPVVVVDPKIVDVEKPVHHSRNITLASSILLGDAFHNFTDGIFIGNAFLLCDRAVAWTIVATTIYHELAQEIADYALLVHHCGLTRFQALSLNFVSGFSVMIGAIVILSLDLSNLAIGIVMAISAGVYLYIAASECIPRVQAKRKAPCDTLSFLFCFMLGAIPIGLVLLNHSHCEAH